MTLILERDVDIVKMYRYTKDKVYMSTRSISNVKLKTDAHDKTIHVVNTLGGKKIAAASLEHGQAEC